jgi:RHS repeat-associated protein
VAANDVTPAATDLYATTSGTNRLASITSAAGTRAISYDARGNTLSETRPASVSVTAAYDGYARLTSYAQGGTSFAHVYNGLDDRVATTTGGTTRRYVYDADGRILGEYGASAADVKAEYLWLSATAANDNQSFGGDDGTGGYTPLAIATAPTGGSATLSWVHTNHLGVPLTTTDATGTEIAAPSTATALGFPGQMKTLPDLWYNRHRDYDPTSGRYIQADPIGLDGDANPYGYASANPLGNIDPEGLQGMTMPVVRVAPRFNPRLPAGRRNLRSENEWFPDPPPPGTVRFRHGETFIGRPGFHVSQSNLIESRGQCSSVAWVGYRELFRGRYKRNPRLRRDWERYTGQTWPYDARSGRNWDVSHEIARADGGPDHVTNIRPRLREDHIKRHQDNGDPARWGARRN